MNKFYPLGFLFNRLLSILFILAIIFFVYKDITSKDKRFYPNGNLEYEIIKTENPPYKIIKWYYENGNLMLEAPFYKKNIKVLLNLTMKMGS